MNTDTKAVARWDWDVEIDDYEQFDDGHYVLFTDHERIVEEIGLLWARELVKRDEALAASRAEVEGLKDMVRTMQNNPEFDFDAAMENGNV